MQKNKTLVLDYSKWRCGYESKDNRLGKGYTALLNNNKHMCCLGQFSLQLNPVLKEDDIKGADVPSDLKVKIPLLSKRKNGYIIETDFSNKAIHINDNEETTPAQKIISLRKLLAKHKYKLKVINKK